MFSGDLSQVMLPDVINFAYNSRLSGRLTVFSREVFGEIFIEEGNFIFATSSRKGSRNIFLTDLLLKDGRLSANGEELNQYVAEARSRNIPIGRILVERNLLTDAELMDYLQQHAQDRDAGVTEAVRPVENDHQGDQHGNKGDGDVGQALFSASA